MIPYYLGASVFVSIRKITTGEYKRFLNQNSRAVSGLSFNPQNRDQDTVVQNLLSGELAETENLIIWHDVISNSLTKHENNFDTSLSPSELIKQILEFKKRISCIVYAHKKGTEDIFDQLIETGILVLHVVDNLSSKRNARLPDYNRELAKLHPNSEVELGLLRVVEDNLQDLRALTKKSRSKRSKPSKEKRERKRRREQQL